MPSPVPAVREVAWISIVPQLLIMAVLISTSYTVMTPHRIMPSVAVGAGTYLLYSQVCRRLVTRRIRRGFRLLKRNALAEAIAEYEKAYEFFSRHSWVDRFRYVTLLSSSAYSYRETALCSIAFAYSQMGDGANAAKFNRRALAEFPDCAVARTSLKGIEALSRLNRRDSGGNSGEKVQEGDSAPIREGERNVGEP